MKKPDRYVVLGDFDTLIDIKRVNNWALVESPKRIENGKEIPNEVFIQFKYLDKELVSVKYANVSKLNRFLISWKLKKIAKNMTFYKI